MNLSQAFSANQDLSDNDFDSLVSDLLRREPPSGLVRRIMDLVHKLPAMQIIQPEQEEMPDWDWRTDDHQLGHGLVVHHEHLPPS